MQPGGLRELEKVLELASLHSTIKQVRRCRCLLDKDQAPLAAA
jgi:hypothetical protein